MSNAEISPRNRAERRMHGKKARAAGAVLTAGSAALAMGAAWVGTGGITAAGASTFTVANTNDSGAGSLRQAVIDANNNAGADTIDFAPGLAGGTITLTTGQIDIQEDLTITGLGSSSLTVSGGDASRIFAMAPSTVTISGLTLTHGSASAVNAAGGAILNNGGALTLDGVVVSNSAASGGGGGVSSTGSGSVLTVLNSSITGNQATGTGGNDGGGGIHANGYGTQVTVANSVISGNAATNRWAGGIYFYGDTGALDIESTTISGNTASQGGGGGWLGGDGQATVNNSTVSGNSANARNGGGLYFYTDGVTITNSTFTGNSASEYGGGAHFDRNELGVTITGSTFSGNDAFYGGGTAFYYETGAVNITATTISGNTAGEGGGGVFAGNDGASSPGSITVRDSTVSGNSADGWGGGLYLTEIEGGVQILNSTISGNTALEEGGGINFNGYYGLTLVQDTITDNTGAKYGGLYLPSNVGPASTRKTKAERVRSSDDVDRPGHSENSHGGVHSAATRLDVDGEATLIGTIISGNHGASAVGADVGPGGLIHSDHSLLGLVGPDTILDDVAGTLLGVDPLLGPLANNGGPTQTHELLTGSPAIDTGPVPASTSTVFTGDFDQREAPFLRVQNGTIDIGAFEVQVPTPIDIAPKFTG